MHGHTLHTAVTIPLAIYFARLGWQVAYAINGPTFLGVSYGFSDRYIRANPTSVSIVNAKSLRFVARLIGYEEEWLASQRRTEYVKTGSFDGYEAIVATTKDIPRLRQMGREHGLPAFAVGYQHIPFMARVDAPLHSHNGAAERDSVFLTDNAFSQSHKFPEVLSGCGLRLCGFTNLDRPWAYRRDHEDTDAERRWVLIFHPGGYRGVVSQPSDPKGVCHANQKAFVERLCLPLVKAGYTPVIKIHPLRARFHDLEDVTEIVAGVERENGLDAGGIVCVGPESWYWEYALKSSFILTFGSSSVYELWSAGLRNVFVCNFEGQARSRRFDFFESIFIESYEQYLDLISTESFRGLALDPLTAKVFDGYSSLFNGRSTQTAYELINGELGP